MIPKFLKLFVRVEWRKYNFSFHSKILWTRRGRRRQLEVHTCWKRKSNVILRGTWRNAELTPGTGLLPVASYKLHSHRWPSRPSWQIFLHWQPFLPNLLLAVTGSDCRNVRCQSSTSPVSTRLRLNPAAVRSALATAPAQILVLQRRICKDEMSKTLTMPNSGGMKSCWSCWRSAERLVWIHVNIQSDAGGGKDTMLVIPNATFSEPLWVRTAVI